MADILLRCYVHWHFYPTSKYEDILELGSLGMKTDLVGFKHGDFDKYMLLGSISI